MRTPQTIQVIDQTDTEEPTLAFILSIMEAPTVETQYWIVQRGTPFANFVKHEGEWRYEPVANDNGRFHNNTPWDFAQNMSKRLGPSATPGLPFDLYMLKRTLTPAWPASPNIMSLWKTYGLSEDAANYGVVFRAAEAKDLQWARREEKLLGGPKQRFVELYALPTVAPDGEPLSVPLPNETYVETEVTETATPPAPYEPSFSWVAQNDSDNLNLYAAVCQYVQLLPQVAAPVFVGGQIEYDTHFQDVCEPFDGLTNIRVRILEIYNDDNAAALQVRFSRSDGDTIVSVAALTVYSAKIPEGGYIEFGGDISIQIKPGATDSPYRIRYQLA